MDYFLYNVLDYFWKCDVRIDNMGGRYSRKRNKLFDNRLVFIIDDNRLVVK